MGKRMTEESVEVSPKEEPKPPTKVTDSELWRGRALVAAAGLAQLRCAVSQDAFMKSQNELVAFNGELAAKYGLTGEIDINPDGTITSL